MASPRVPLSGHLARRPSVFMCPISGSMALRRRRSFFSTGVKSRLAPEIRTRVVSTPWPRLSGIQECPAGQWIATVDNSQFRPLVRQDFHLLQRLGQSVTVVWIAGQRPHADDEALVDCRGDADLGAEFVAHSCLAFGDAVDVGLMQGVNLAAALYGLVQQARDQHQGVEDRFP